jgi:hypothetical protein
MNENTGNPAGGLAGKGANANGFDGCLVRGIQLPFPVDWTLEPLAA